jgi:hypothetical protein
MGAEVRHVHLDADEAPGTGVDRPGLEGDGDQEGEQGEQPAREAS